MSQHVRVHRCWRRFGLDIVVLLVVALVHCLRVRHQGREGFVGGGGRVGRVVGVDGLADAVERGDQIGRPAHVEGRDVFVVVRALSLVAGVGGGVEVGEGHEAGGGREVGVAGCFGEDQGGGVVSVLGLFVSGAELLVVEGGVGGVFVEGDGVVDGVVEGRDVLRGEDGTGVLDMRRGREVVGLGRLGVVLWWWLELLVT